MLNVYHDIRFQLQLKMIHLKETNKLVFYLCKLSLYPPFHRTNEFEQLHILVLVGPPFWFELVRVFAPDRLVSRDNIDRHGEEGAFWNAHDVFVCTLDRLR